MQSAMDCNRIALEHPGTGPDVAVAVDDPELDVEAVQQLVVVHGGPVEEVSNVDAAGDRIAGHLQAAFEGGASCW